MTSCEAPYIETLRAEIERQYDALGGTGCGGSFGEVLCYEMHTQGRTFVQLAQHWGVSLPTLGDLIADHCRRLEDLPCVAGIRGPNASGPREGAAGRAVLAEPRPQWAPPPRAIDRCEALRERFGLRDAKLLESYATIAGLERQLEETRNALFPAACNAPSATEGAE